MLIPLDMLAAGEQADVAHISGESAWINRLAEMGLREGCRLEMLQPGATCLLKLADCKLCLRGHESSQILVELKPALA